MTSPQFPVKLEERVASGLYYLRLMESMLHGRHDWQVSLNGDLYPATVSVDDDRLGVKIGSLRLTEPLTAVLILLRDGEEVWWNQVQVVIPAYVVEVDWWFSLLPSPV